MAEREDLGAQLSRATRSVIALEQPLLDQHGITMWEYVVLLRLRAAPVQSQLELAQTIHYDKTRLIALLEGLQQRDLVAREPVPDDRRARSVRLTDAGSKKVDAVQRAIHEVEDQLFTATELETLKRLTNRLKHVGG